MNSESKCNRCCTYFISIKYSNRETSPRLQGAKLGNCTRNTNKMHQIHSSDDHRSLAGCSSGQLFIIKVWTNLSSPEIPPLSDILCWCCGQPWILLKGRNKSWSSTTTSQMQPPFPRQRNWIRPHHWPCTAAGERNTLRQAGCQLFVWWTERFVWVCRTAEKWTQATAVQPGEHAFTLKRTPACLPNPAFCLFSHTCAHRRLLTHSLPPVPYSELPASWWWCWGQDAAANISCSF